MADERSESSRRGTDDGRSRRAARPQASGMQIAQRAREAVGEMTGLEVESISGIERGDEGTWRVTVEVLEVERIPDTDDLLGSYQAEMDESGELVGLSRTHRYARAQTGATQGARPR